MKRLKSTFDKIGVFVLLAALAYSADGSRSAAFAEDLSGEELFRKHCQGCHKSPSAFRDFDTLEDIIAVIRKPSNRMPEFDEGKMPGSDALKIAAYIKLQRYVDVPGNGR
jgi:mono/diheme cytochrome c family protein